MATKVTFSDGRTVTFKRKKAKKGAKKGNFMKGRIAAPKGKKHGALSKRVKAEARSGISGLTFDSIPFGGFPLSSGRVKP